MAGRRPPTPAPVRLALLLLALSLPSMVRGADLVSNGVVVQASTSTVACPAGSLIRSTKLSNRGTVNTFFKSPPTVVKAKDSAECIAIAQRLRCFGGQASFFVFIAAGHLNAQGLKNVGNCSIGKACGSLKSGTAAATYGLVPFLVCPSTTPSSLVACPATTATSAALTLDVSNPFNMFQDGEPYFARVDKAADCQAIARTAKCLNYGTKFYVYTAVGFYWNNALLGNCAYGATCFNLTRGTVNATAGSVATAQCAAAGPPATPIPCPTSPQMSILSIDTSQVYNFTVFTGNQGRISDAANASACLDEAQSFECRTSKTTDFFLYSSDGFYHPLGFYYGNCAYGPGCAGLETLSVGNKTVTAGPVPDIACTAPPPPPPPPPSTNLACPTSTKRQAMRIDLSRFSEFFNDSLPAVIDVAGGAAGCQDQARLDKCSGNPGIFFLYNEAGFPDPHDPTVILGNCAFGTKCDMIYSGTTLVSSALTASCPSPPPPPRPPPPKKPPPPRPKPPPPLRKPPPPRRKPPPPARKPPPPARKPPPPRPKPPPPAAAGSSLRRVLSGMCKGGVLSPQECKCPSWSRCVRTDSCMNLWVCQCLPGRGRRIEHPSTGRLIACERQVATG